MAKKKITITVDKEVFERFKSYCEQNGMKVSSKVELLMREGMKNASLRSFIEKEN